MSACVGCRRPLYYHERVAHPQEYCRQCAKERGITRLCDAAPFVKAPRGSADAFIVDDPHRDDMQLDLASRLAQREMDRLKAEREP